MGDLLIPILRDCDVVATHKEFNDLLTHVIFGPKGSRAREFYPQFVQTLLDRLADGSLCKGDRPRAELQIVFEQFFILMHLSITRTYRESWMRRNQVYWRKMRSLVRFFTFGMDSLFLRNSMLDETGPFAIVLERGMFELVELAREYYVTGVITVHRQTKTTDPVTGDNLVVEEERRLSPEAMICKYETCNGIEIEDPCRAFFASICKMEAHLFVYPEERQQFIGDLDRCVLLRSVCLATPCLVKPAPDIDNDLLARIVNKGKWPPPPTITHKHLVIHKSGTVLLFARPVFIDVVSSRKLYADTEVFDKRVGRGAFRLLCNSVRYLVTATTQKEKH